MKDGGKLNHSKLKCILINHIFYITNVSLKATKEVADKVLFGPIFKCCSFKHL